MCCCELHDGGVFKADQLFYVGPPLETTALTAYINTRLKNHHWGSSPPCGTLRLIHRQSREYHQGILICSVCSQREIIAAAMDI